MPPTSPPLDDLGLLDIRALVALGLAAHARRAWLARAKAAPIPPPPAPRGRHVSVAELDEAIAAGLARGHSSLEEKRRGRRGAIGVTGTRDGITPAQRGALTALLVDLQPVELHHGDCVGADADIHNLVERFTSATVVSHPPDNPSLRAFCAADEERKPRPYLERNHAIVNETARLIAAPAGPETQRSGTWATIRYAAAQGRPITIVWPDGSIEEREGKEVRMAKVHVKLVPEPSTRERRAPCVVCGLSLAPAVPGVPVCGPCADAPEQARQRLEVRRQGHARALAAAEEEVEAALEALDEQDRVRWGKIGAWRLATTRTGRWEGTGGDAQARLDKIKAAVHGEDTRVSSALRRAWFADECAFWARAGAVEELRRADVAGELLEAAVAAQSPAETVRVASLSAPGTVYAVAADGSTCSCPGFRRHGHCKHAKARRDAQAA